jgi:hypothetical protein
MPIAVRCHGMRCSLLAVISAAALHACAAREQSLRTVTPAERLWPTDQSWHMMSIRYMPQLFKHVAALRQYQCLYQW